MTSPSRETKWSAGEAFMDGTRAAKASVLEIAGEGNTPEFLLKAGYKIVPARGGEPAKRTLLPPQPEPDAREFWRRHIEKNP